MQPVIQVSGVGGKMTMTRRRRRTTTTTMTTVMIMTMVVVVVVEEEIRQENRGILPLPATVCKEDG